MKLYAQVSSDRAIKGQGGNKWIETALFVGSADDPRKIGTLSIHALPEGTYDVEWCDAYGKTILLDDGIFDRNEKGKSQKAETMHRCDCKCGCDYKLDGYAEGETTCGACLDNCKRKGKRQKAERRCWAQVGDDWCGNIAEDGDYCAEHAEEFEGLASD